MNIECHQHPPTTFLLSVWERSRDGWWAARIAEEVGYPGGRAQHCAVADPSIAEGLWTWLNLTTLSPLIMEVENGCIWRVTTIGGTHFLLLWLWEEGYFWSTQIIYIYSRQAENLLKCANAKSLDMVAFFSVSYSMLEYQRVATLTSMFGGIMFVGQFAPEVQQTSPIKGYFSYKGSRRVFQN